MFSSVQWINQKFLVNLCLYANDNQIAGSWMSQPKKANPEVVTEVNLGVAIFGSVFSCSIHIGVHLSIWTSNLLFLRDIFLLLIYLIWDLRKCFSLRWFLKVSLLWVKWWTFQWSPDLSICKGAPKCCQVMCNSEICKISGKVLPSNVIQNGGCFYYVLKSKITLSFQGDFFFFTAHRR